MKLSEAIEHADGGPIRLSTEPTFIVQVVSGKFYYIRETPLEPTKFDPPVALTLEQILSNNWEFEKRIWVGKKERKVEAGT